MAIKRTTIILSAILLAALGVSVLLFMLQGYSKTDRVFFFPKDHTLEITGEARAVPRQINEEENIEEYILEWFLGPLVLENRSLFPKNTKLLTILYRNRILYLDFSMNILMKTEKSPLNFHEILDVVKHGVNFNFPEVETIVFTVEGEPVSPDVDGQ